MPVRDLARAALRGQAQDAALVLIPKGPGGRCGGFDTYGTFATARAALRGLPLPLGRVLYKLVAQMLIHDSISLY